MPDFQRRLLGDLLGKKITICGHTQGSFPCLLPRNQLLWCPPSSQHWCAVWFTVFLWQFLWQGWHRHCQLMSFPWYSLHACAFKPVTHPKERKKNKHNNQQAPQQNRTAKFTGTSKKQRVPPLSVSPKSSMIIIGLDGGMVDAAVSKTVVRKHMWVRLSLGARYQKIRFIDIITASSNNLKIIWLYHDLVCTQQHAQAFDLTNMIFLPRSMASSDVAAL